MQQSIVNDARLLFLSPKDNVCTAIAGIEGGTTLHISGQTVLVKQAIPLGFKLASCNLSVNDKIVKYGVPIGSATRDIAIGEIVHVHNMKSDYLPTYVTEVEDRK
jgi:altronate dehydratase small subunit